MHASIAALLIVLIIGSCQRVLEDLHAVSFYDAVLKLPQDPNVMSVYCHILLYS